MNQILHRAADRIVNDFGWLRIHASFRDDAPSQDRKKFLSLLILDDATMIPGGRGFKLHPHENMEIISWILSGTDEHNDSENGITLLQGGQVQLMSAGTGIEHAENNSSETEGVHMFQIWIEPAAKNVRPTYQVKKLKDEGKNKLYTFVSPDGAGGSLQINQQAYLSTVALTKGNAFEYNRYREDNGVYIFVLVGQLVVNEIYMMHRDALGVYPGFQIKLTATEAATVLFIEVPEE